MWIGASSQSGWRWNNRGILFWLTLMFSLHQRNSNLKQRGWDFRLRVSGSSSEHCSARCSLLWRSNVPTLPPLVDLRWKVSPQNLKVLLHLLRPDEEGLVGREPWLGIGEQISMNRNRTVWVMTAISPMVLSKAIPPFGVVTCNLAG